MAEVDLDRCCKCELKLGDGSSLMNLSPNLSPAMQHEMLHQILTIRRFEERRLNRHLLHPREGIGDYTRSALDRRNRIISAHPGHEY
jgi:hypothetical protein